MINPFLKGMLKRNKVKIYFKKETYRYNQHCSKCGEFKTKNHECPGQQRKIGNKYRCNRCNIYLDYEFFQKDCTKKYGINTRCKECRAATGNGNKKNKIRLIK